MRRCVLAAVVVALAGCGGGSSPAPTATPRAGGPDAANPMTHERAIDQIAREHGGTRAAGTPGGAATADYIAQNLKATGFAVRRQRFPIVTSLIVHEPKLTVDGRAVETVPLQFTHSGDVSGPLRAARGLGCRSADYAGLPHGAVAVARRGGCFFRVAARLAERAGAGALLIRSARPMSGTLVVPNIHIPVLSIGAGAPRRGAAHLTVTARVKRTTTENVIGELDGGPRVVMAGAHLDSVPNGPGVNDDGSGVSALLAIARRAQARPVRGATLRLGFWSAEEIGLVGSMYYAHHLPTGDRDAIRDYLNLDMIASPHPAKLVYGDAAVTDVLRDFVPGARDVDVAGRSDHASFQAIGVPAGGLFTGDETSQDPCYHQACDDLSNVNATALQQMTDAAEASLRRLAG
jgi:Iap family predicted aminopeptidase